MLSAEPLNVQEFVTDVKNMLVNYHTMTRMNSLSLLPLPSQTKSQKWERTLMLSGLLNFGRPLSKVLPVSLSDKLSSKMIDEYLKSDMFGSDLSAWLGEDKVKQIFSKLSWLSREAHSYNDKNLPKEKAFKMVRLLWILAFFTKPDHHPSPVIFPYAALYPLVDDMLDSPVYTKLQKTRLLERIHRHLDVLLDASAPELSPPLHPEEGVEERMISDCLQDMIHGLSHLNPADRFEIAKSLDTVRYAEELDFLSETGSDIDAYARSAVKGAATLKTLFLLSGDPDLARLCNGELVMVYGFITQMVDDLQDAKRDFEANIETPFSRLIREKRNLDPEIIHLIQFIQSPYLNDLITKSGHLIGPLHLLNSFLIFSIMQVSIEHRHHLSVQMYKEVRHRIPMTKQWMKRHYLEKEMFDWFTF